MRGSQLYTDLYTVNCLLVYLHYVGTAVFGKCMMLPFRLVQI